MSLIIYSGGLDSTVLLHYLASENKLKGALGVCYGQRHLRELDYARENCKKLGVPFELADISALINVFGKNSLTDTSTEVPDGDYNEDNMKSTVVPNRNMILLSIAAARAIAIGAESIAYAAHSGDHSIYPDCREEFANAMDAVLQLCHYTPIRLARPFVNMNKAQIVSLGARLGVDFSQTWSCYKGGEKHCGVCGTCLERKEAFRLANVVDTTEYLA